MQRRDFIRLSLAGAAILMMPTGVLASEEHTASIPPMLILIELEGGNDGLNTVVPYGDGRYTTLRPTLALGETEVLRIDDAIGLHPALSGLHDQWEEGRLAIVEGVGYPQPNRSHFRSKDIWNTASNSDEYLNDGWAGNVLGPRQNPGPFADSVTMANDDTAPFAHPQMRNVVLRSAESYLETAGYSVEWVTDAETAAEHTYDRAFRCYLFDVNVPGMNGFELLQGLREAGDETPAIFITARSGMADLREGFDVGATDYLSKPFRMEELLIRLDARLHRPSRLPIGKRGWLDPQTLTLSLDGEETVLPRKACEILHYFLTHRERIVGKDEIEEILYEGETIADATFRVYIRQINRQLGTAARLVNVRGVGYRYESA